jgi:hypothetical protein
MSCRMRLGEAAPAVGSPPVVAAPLPFQTQELSQEVSTMRGISNFISGVLIVLILVLLWVFISNIGAV